MTEKTLLRIAVILLFIIGLFIGTTFGQEAVEASSQEEISLSVAITTPTPTRKVSVKDLAELGSAQVALSNAQAVVNHVLGRIILEYQIDVRTEAINSRTGEILTVAPIEE